MTLHTSELPVELPTSHEVPCLSLYQPTHRRHPENRQDAIRYRNLLKDLESSVRQKYPARHTRPLLEPFHALADERDFWNHTLDGLAVLAAPNLFHIYKLQRSVAELAIAADTFHTKPLLRILQSADRYQVLGLSREAIRLFEGNRYALDEIDLEPGVPRTIKDELGDERSEPHQTVASYGGAGGASAPMRHGQGGKKDRMDIDVDRFFRAVDRSILEHHSRPSRLPLMLAALPEYHGVFRKISQNPFLMSEGIDVHPEAVPIDELRERAWRIVRPHYQARLSKLVEEFRQAQARGLADDQLQQVASATVSGRVATLLIEADREIPGRVDSATGNIEFGDLDHPEVDDLLDDVGELASNKGGQTVVVAKEMMPTETGVAAIYRY
jgi:Bacterial archaeo-eukaryotic release factor family 3